MSDGHKNYTSGVDVYTSLGEIQGRSRRMGRDRLWWSMMTRDVPPV